MPDEILPSDILTADEVAALLKVDRRTVIRLANAKKLPAKRIGRNWRFSSRKLREYLEGAPRKEVRT